MLARNIMKPTENHPPTCSLILGDCLEIMKSIPDGSVDMVLCDLPYGTTACKWDSVIPFTPLWAQYRRVCKHNAAIVLTASQPFTSALVMSNSENWKHSWVWDKGVGVNYMHAKRQPLKTTEDIMVFCFGTPRYFPQMTPKDKPTKKKPTTSWASLLAFQLMPPILSM